MLSQILLPERWVAQPKVVPMHVLREPGRNRMSSILGERRAKTISTYAAAPNVSKNRMLAVDMQPPDATGLQVLQWILLAGDRRYWSWSAVKAQAGGNIRNSLQYELGVDKSNMARSLRKLLDDGVVSVGEKQDGRQWIAFTELGRLVFAEAEWRWKLRNWVPELQPFADDYGWQEIGFQVAHRIVVDGLDETRRADVIFAAKDQLKDGVEAGGAPQIPGRWTK